MATASGSETYKAYGAYPVSYANGLAISNNATTPNTKLDIAAGVIIDSTNTFQMINNSVLTLSAATNGLNGLDTGSLGASKVYAVYLISSPFGNGAVGCLLSLSLTAPLMPFGYSAFALIGYATTDASSHFLLGYWTSGNSGNRKFMYDAALATAITAGASTTYAAVNLTLAVPNVNNLPVYVLSAFTPTAAASALNLQPGNAVGSMAVVLGQVSAVVIDTISLVLAQPTVISTVSSPTINYKCVGAVAISVQGYEFYI